MNDIFMDIFYDVFFRYRVQGNYGSKQRALEILARRSNTPITPQISNMFSEAEFIFDESVDLIQSGQYIDTTDNDTGNARFLDVEFDKCMKELKKLTYSTNEYMLKTILGWVIFKYYAK